jgi:rSAM/selenodomain-associated transferase 2
MQHIVNNACLPGCENQMALLPELSVVVPVLNEEATLPALFATLAGQEGLRLELIVSDGGSTDGSVDLTRRLGERAPFTTTLLQGEQGRGKQLNAGARASRGETLFFMHADSCFRDRKALHSSLQLLNRKIACRGDERVAGRFSLCFDRCGASPSLPYYFYECKARLNRSECSHGDQGIMLRRRYFDEAGPFDGALPMLAETRLAGTLRKKGEWLLFPAEIITSARRFESEGLYERQVMNAIIMNFASQGWEAFFRDLPAIYPAHDRSGRIALSPMLQTISLMIGALPPGRRISLWYNTGDYVRSHAWQIPFFLDTRRNFRNGVPSGKGETHLLDFHDRYLNRLTDHIPGRLAAAILTWIWFRLTIIHLRISP